MDAPKRIWAHPAGVWTVEEVDLDHIRYVRADL